MLDKQGIAIDLVVLRKLLRGVVAIYDHQSLNQMMTCTPTAENIARVIFTKLKTNSAGTYLTGVAVQETPSTVVIYTEEAVPTPVSEPTSKPKEDNNNVHK